jgi:signal transduction histidine kinase
MEVTRARSAVFFIQYLVLLLVALAWVQFGFVRRRMGGGNVSLFYWLIGAAFCYLGVRAYVVLRKRITGKWSSLWLSLDLFIITASVYLTGGIDSEAALLYFWPIATSSIRRLPRRTTAVSLAVAALYLIATWPNHTQEKYWGTMMVRLVVLLMVTSLALYYSLTEAALIEELARLREEVALSDYRNRLSREMHDGIQHYLADIALRLELARKLMATDPAAAARSAVDQRFPVRQAAAELRYLVGLLRSPAVEREGFVSALRHHLSAFAAGSSMSAPLEVNGEVQPLPPGVAHAAFRIVQEAMTNAEKYAHATEVKVTVSFGADRFECSVRDDGGGFDVAGLPQAPTMGGGFGLPGMVQRAESVGGKVEVSSTVGEGTVVTFVAPAGETGTARKGP